MSSTRPNIPARISFLYTNIGRGHPFYLDGIIEALIRSQAINLVRRELDVFEMSSGLSRMAWQTAGWLYRKGASGGPIGKLYGRLRRNGDYNRETKGLALLARDIRAALLDDPDPLIVAHPSLVGMLRDKPEIIYQHGELVTPDEAVVKGASTILVPTSDAASPFLEAGYEPHQVIKTGLCIELALIKQAADAYVRRTEMYRSDSPLVGAFFSSGAEPPPHLRRLVAAAVAVAATGGRVILFAQDRGRFARKAALAFSERSISFAAIDAADSIPAELPRALIVRHSNRREENSLTARFFPLFDYLVAPPHERTNWALGLGLPMFIVGPDIGPFAPLNRRVLLESGAGNAIEASMDAHLFGARVNRLRARGDLEKMAQCGWGKREINGFARIAAFLVSKYATI